MEKTKLYFLIILLLCNVMGMTHANPIKSYVFISFSMPEPLLIEILKEADLLKIPSYLNGLYQHSMQKTIHRILRLSNKIKNLTIQIDPRLFERFSIHAVPALVVSNGKKWDVIYGNLSLSAGLERIADQGECGLKLNQIKSS